MRILILGANGILGHILFLLLNNNNNILVHGICGKSVSANNFYLENIQKLKIVDLTDVKVLTKIIDEFKPDFVINCTVKKNEPNIQNDYIENIFINSLLPHIITNLSEKYNFKFIHISTDSVLGSNFKLANEKSQYKANDFYSATKLIGEVVSSNNAITIRTSIIGHSLSGNSGLIDWILSKNKLLGFSKCFYSGTTALELSKQILKIIQNPHFNNGLYHIGAKKISKYMLLKKISIFYNLKNTIEKDNNIIINRILDTTKFNNIYNYNSPNWNQLLLETKDFHQKNINIYA
jgi:dTDP-4-dehydrorhamnose reductase